MTTFRRERKNLRRRTRIRTFNKWSLRIQKGVGIALISVAWILLLKGNGYLSTVQEFGLAGLLGWIGICLLLTKDKLVEVNVK